MSNINYRLTVEQYDRVKCIRTPDIYYQYLPVIQEIIDSFK